jgi:hypothetical protein
MAGMVLNRRTNNNAAVLIEFDSDFPGPQSDPEKDSAKVTKLSFLPVGITQALTSLSDWPEDSCPLK